VRALWLTGSLAAGTADAHSDVDLRLAVRPEAFGSIGEWWPSLVETVSPTVWARRWSGTPAEVVISAITTAYLRFDVVVQPAAETAGPPPGAAHVLFDKDGIGRRPDPTNAAPPPNLPDRIAFTVEEFIRLVGMLRIVVGRDDLPIGMEGQMACHSLLIGLLLLENGLDRLTMGKRHVAPLLNDEQRAVIASVPPLEPTMDSVIRGRVAYARLFLPRARRLMERHGLAYPQPFEDATRRHLKEALQLEI
jgi:hypothetical protein